MRLPPKWNLRPTETLAEQKKIEAEQPLVEANRRLIERMEQKIAGAWARLWGG